MKLIGTSCALVLVPMILWRIPLLQSLLQDMRHWAHHPYSYALFFILAVPYCAIGLSRQALCLAAGSAFGGWEGFALCSCAYQVGALLGYGWGYWVGHSDMARVFPRLEAFLQHSPFRAVLGIRLMPVGSALLVSVTSGGIRLPIMAFFWATLAGGIPQNSIFALLGSGLQLGHQKETYFSAVFFIVSALIGMAILSSARKRGTLPL